MGAASARTVPIEEYAPSRVSPIELSVIGIFVFISSFAVLYLCFQQVTGLGLASRDYIAYWATGRQLIHHGNPYDAAAIISIEETGGYFATNKPLLMRNPPTALFVTLPLGLFGARFGSLLWLLILLGCLTIIVRLLWILHKRPRNQIHLLAFFFAPILACLLTGQTSLFALLGLTLFLYLHHDRPAIAGASLALCAVKPHLFLPFVAGLLVIVVFRRSYRVLAGAVISLTACVAIALNFDHSVLSHYAQMLRTDAIGHEFIPTVGALLRLAIDRDAFSLQFLPAIAGCVWAVWFAWTHRNDWDWAKHGSILVLVSALVAPYSWFTDQVIVWPALLYGFYVASRGYRITLLAVMAAATAQTVAGLSLHSALFLWPGIAWVTWYLFATKMSGPVPLQERKAPQRIALSSELSATRKFIA
jgi:hypothetical protein